MGVYLYINHTVKHVPHIRVKAYTANIGANVWCILKHRRYCKMIVYSVYRIGRWSVGYSEGECVVKTMCIPER